MENNMVVGVRTLLKGLDCDFRNNYISKIVKIKGDEITLRIKYKSNMCWDEALKNYVKNYDRFYKVITLTEYNTILNERGF